MYPIYSTCIPYAVIEPKELSPETDLMGLHNLGIPDSKKL
jgi:hypothetical protein